MFVHGLLDTRHQVFVVVLQGNDAGAGGADLGNVEIGARVAIKGGQRGAHVDSMLRLYLSVGRSAVYKIK